MQTRRAARGFALITLVYLCSLLWLDSRRQVFAGLPALALALPPMLAASLMSYLVRFARWHRLLMQAGHRLPLCHGLLAYVAGFAFTATPGKVGELLRIRYLQDVGVPPSRTLAAFVCERGADLLAVMILGALFIHRTDVLAVAAAFVAAIFVLVAAAATHPALLTRMAARLRKGWSRPLSRAVRILRDGLAGCRTWATPWILVQALLLGLLAWGITSWSFVHLLDALQISVPERAAWSVYPLSMLAGAASMLPGGLGSTEATIVALLTGFDSPWEQALLCAIGIRLASFWFAIVLGLACMMGLEWQRRPGAQAGPSRSQTTE